jgi:hypothetical protein
MNYGAQSEYRPDIQVSAVRAELRDGVNARL